MHCMRLKSDTNNLGCALQPDITRQGSETNTLGPRTKQPQCHGGVVDRPARRHPCHTDVCLQAPCSGSGSHAGISIQKAWANQCCTCRCEFHCNSPCACHLKTPLCQALQPTHDSPTASLPGVMIRDGVREVNHDCHLDVVGVGTVRAPIEIAPALTSATA